MGAEMRAVVFAYHTFGVIGLEALCRHGFTPAWVYTHEDDPKEEVWFGSVSAWCREHQVPFSTPADVNRPEEVERIRALHPDFIFSFYYRRLLAAEVLSVPPQGALNLHGSLLPKYRGRAPVNWAILNGETETGLTLHYMVPRSDAGDIVGQIAVPITLEDTALTVYRKLEPAARELLDELLPRLKAGTAPRWPNLFEGERYYSGRRPEDGKIDWTRSAREIHNLVRAVTHPYPGAFGVLEGERFLLWRTRPEAAIDGLGPGVIAIRGNEVYIGTGAGALLVSEIGYQGRDLTGAELLAEMKKYEGKALT
jgi:methionyl-tRNA formyltransferase